MFVLAYRYRRRDDTRTFHSAESGQRLRISAAPRLVCKWQNSAQGPLVCSWRPIGPTQAARPVGAQSRRPGSKSDAG